MPIIGFVRFHLAIVNRTASLLAQHQPTQGETKMPDDLTKRRPQDSSKINVHEPYELNYWSDHFGVSKEKIKDAVRAVGVMVDKVKAYLGK